MHYAYPSSACGPHNNAVPANTIAATVSRLPSENPLDPRTEAALPVAEGDGGDGVFVVEGLESSDPPVRADSSGSVSKLAVTEEALAQELLASLVPDTKLTTAHCTTCVI